jgi:hypothetical protein
MHVCYIDEAGNDQVLSTADAPPVLAIAGLTLAEARLKDFTWRFLNLKKKFNPSLCSGKLTDVIRTEIKGADLRSDLRSGSRRRRTRAIAILDDVVDLIEDCGATLVGQVWVKADGTGVPDGFYPDAIAGMAADMQAMLAAADSRGLMILDARTKWKNVPSVNGITTRRFRSGGDPLSCMIESPVFGHSDTHVALQVADLVASALIFPMACAVYCQDLQGNVHAHHSAYADLHERYGPRLLALEHKYVNSDGYRKGGIQVRDKRNQQPRHLLYSKPTLATTKAAPVVPLQRDPKARKRFRGGVQVTQSEATPSA